MRERAVRFACGSEQLVGILHEPEADVTPRQGVLFLAPHIQGKTGPARSYVRYARRLAAAGWWAFRFDFPGFGDSEGEVQMAEDSFEGLPPERSRELIQAATHAFAQEARLDRVIVYGHCGGGRMALHAVAVPGLIEGLVFLGLPLLRSASDVGQPSSPKMLNVRGYLRKIRHWTYWKRFLTLRSDYRFLLRVLWLVVRGPAGEQALVDHEVGKRIVAALDRGQRLLFLYGDQDPFYKTFAVGFQPRLAALQNGRPWDYAARVIQEASHASSQAAAQRQVIEELLAWLQTRYPAQSPMRAG